MARILELCSGPHKLAANQLPVASVKCLCLEPINTEFIEFTSRQFAGSISFRAGERLPAG